LGLLVELEKTVAKFDFDGAKLRIAEIARGIRNWPRQRNRERKERGENPLWKVSGNSIERIAALAESSRDFILPLACRGESASGLGRPGRPYLGNAIPCYAGDNSLFGAAQESGLRRGNSLVFRIIENFAGRLVGQNS